MTKDPLIKTAEQALQRFNPTDLWGAVVNSIGDADAALFRAIDPDYQVKTDRRDELAYTIANSQELTLAQLKSAFAEFNKLVEGELADREKAWFFIGFCTASKFLPGWGKEPRP